ncbi:MAG TPA: glycosyltransferase [Opitutaceae bacterium]|nr:glycosyltransferase [Opitutaceae bacterium]
MSSANPDPRCLNGVEPAIPRVLFITNEPPQNTGAGALVFQRLFANYPPDSLLVVTNASLARSEQRLACRYQRVPLLVDRLNRTRLWRWRAVLRSLGASRWVSLARIDAALQDFEPEVVVSLMQDGWIYDLAARYATARKLPLVLFIHDLPDGFEPVGAVWQQRQRERDCAVYRQARVRLCVSRGMSDHFAAAFGVPGDILLPPRSPSTPSQTPESCRNLKVPGRLTLGYAGGLHYGYGEQLLALAPILRRHHITVEIFGAVPQGVVAPLRNASDVFRINGRTDTPEQAWRGVLQRCDVVLQPYLNPPGVHHRQYRTHFPSKLGDCLALGLPLLMTGPEDASGVAWCRTHPGAALTVTDAAASAIEAELNRLRDDGELRVRLATVGQKAASEFDVATARATMLAALRAAT